MELDVEVVSHEIVTPSSPTADGLRRYQLSFLDQLNPLLYNSLVYFYPKICDTDADKITISDRLKRSISSALTYFYPLGGRMTEDQLFVDCNDEGIPFVEARVNCKLSEVLNKPVPKELNKLLPFEIHGDHKILLGIKLNVFDGGGIGIGVCVSHKIGDALSFFSFVKTWAAIARGETMLIGPEFKSASLFPPRDLKGFTPRISQLKIEQLVTKRFVFSTTKVEEIRRKYSEKNTQTRPTRVEALSAFIWDRLTTSINVRSKPNTLFMINHMVNIRPRIEPPLPEYSIGNFFSFSLTIPSMEDGNLVSQMRDSIKAVNNEYVKKLRDGYNHLDCFKEKTASYGKCEIVAFTFTSLCRFPLYEADFGWGKPIWAGSSDREINNVATFMDTITGDGIESWITLKEEEMEKFDSDEELLAYVDAPKSL
ncbi:putative 3'-N-debenzoyl-2'-deoxytaxol N-benzoyltransferase [Hibiscus syriacus]|uniref:3'-N-debenzoyl-2'-deoxytaxol N-benzoyltransferase n=1 Tax=Hibiscus syriacus TaxID=106335 RepID=A0A6A2Y280_HIBSY|nr:stemmadenine O-acetyltransferase-like [Hibiscus syriacus]KAE8663867.1 putative 3'-N-debenzoyl-2'-deoxytaxol N-benzoyltransferase [Hibiscus syriacus]